jgi:hypothetical protein
MPGHLGFSSHGVPSVPPAGIELEGSTNPRVLVQEKDPGFLSEKISHSTCWLYNPGPVLVPQHYTLFICYKPVFTVKMGCENGHDEALETPDSGFPTPQSPSVLGSYDCYRATSTSS